jgi:hypothetical protein
MTIKYNAETLDKALVWSNSKIFDERKKGVKILRQASCLEVGTKNTVFIRTWFITHTDELMMLVSSEKDSDLLWNYIYMLESFCHRYIHLALSTKNGEEFVKNADTIYFENQAVIVVKRLIFTNDMKVLQAVGSFLWLYKSIQTWDIFIKVLSKKKDKNTISHISRAIAVLHTIIIKKQENFEKLISKQQVKKLIALFFVIKPKPSTAIQCSICINLLNEIMEII